eukprot:NODE_176_length_14102_cov_0.889595.p4 type:complete len:417 gc:universal NODE_176_length_14102_cov_0.889595:685-1935(+)
MENLIQKMLDLLTGKVPVRIMGSEVMISNDNTELILNERSPLKALRKEDSKLENIHVSNIPNEVDGLIIPMYLKDALVSSQKKFHANGNNMNIQQICCLLPLFHQSVFSNMIIGLMFKQLQIEDDPIDLFFGLEWEKIFIPVNFDYCLLRVKSLNMTDLDDEDSFYTDTEDDICMNFKEFAFTMTYVSIFKENLLMEENMVSIRMLSFIFESIYSTYEMYVFPLLGNVRECYITYCIQKTLFELGEFRGQIKRRSLRRITQEIAAVQLKENFLNSRAWYSVNNFITLVQDFKAHNAVWNISYSQEFMFQELLKSRIFSGSAFYLNHELSLPFEEYCWLTFSMKLDHPTSQKYWFRTFDTDLDDVLSLYEIEQFMRKSINLSLFLDSNNSTSITLKQLSPQIISEIIHQEPIMEDSF